MSNGTKEPQRSRNRNRGNRNRNRSRNGSSESSSPRNSSSSNRPPSQHQQFVKKATKKLTFWQKLLKMIGLYREPKAAASRPQVGSRRDDSKATAAPKSNVRGTRSPSPESREESGATERSGRGPREKRPPVSGDVESTRLYIGNLSYDASEHDIEDLFKGVGPVRSVEVVYNKHTHKSKGYGFVEMLHIDEAKRAVEILHDQPFMGRKLIVSGAKAKNIEEEHASRQANAPARTERPERSPAPSRAAVATPSVAVAAAAVAESSEPIVKGHAVIEEVTSLATAEVLNPVSSDTESTGSAAVVTETISETAVASSGTSNEVASTEPVATVIPAAAVVTTTETSVTQVAMAEVTDVFVPPAPVAAESSHLANTEASAPAAIVINEVIESVASAPITIEIPSSFAAPVANLSADVVSDTIPANENTAEAGVEPFIELPAANVTDATVVASDSSEAPKGDQP